MKFKVNDDMWEIKELGKDELLELYKKSTDDDTYYVFGVTVKSEHIIYINKDMCFDQKIKTLKHELTHCYIWEYGLYNVTDVNEEVICDLVACSHDFINRIVIDYKQEYENSKCEKMLEQMNIGANK